MSMKSLAREAWNKGRFFFWTQTFFGPSHRILLFVDDTYRPYFILFAHFPTTRFSCAFYRYVFYGC